TAATADTEAAPFAFLEKHDADQDDRQHEVDDEDDLKHGILPARTPPGRRICNASGRVALGTSCGDRPELLGLQAGAADQRAIDLGKPEDLGAIVLLDRPAIEQAHPLRLGHPTRQLAAQVTMDRLDV